MPGMILAEMNFAEGIKTKHINVPPMTATVEIKDVPKDLKTAIDKDKIIVQRMIEASYKQLKDSKKVIQEAIVDFDKNLEKKAPADEKEAEERVKTFNTVCRQITEAQTGLAVKAAEKEWANSCAKKKDLTKFRLLFVKTQILGTISLIVGSLSVAANVAHAAASWGATSPLAVAGIVGTVAGMGKTVFSMASSIYEYARDIETTEKKLTETNLTLAKAYSSGKVNFKAGAREVAAALGVPFVNSTKSMGGLMTEYHAKIAKLDNMSDKLYDEAKKLMAQIAKLDKLETPKNITPLIKTLGASVSKTLDQISSIQAGVKLKEQFYEDMSANLKCYNDLQGAALSKIGLTGEMVRDLAGIASTIKTIVSTAETIAKLIPH